MAKKHLLCAEGALYKANLHSHSTASDGLLTPAEMKAAYQAKGYSVVAYSDHNVVVPHVELTDENFVALTAIEVDISDYRDMTVRHRPSYHLNFFAKDPSTNAFPPFDKVRFREEYGPETINKLIALGNEAGFLAQYNHPRWSHHTVNDFLGLQGLWGFEILNGATEVAQAEGWGDAEYAVMLRRGNYVCSTAGDDNHNCFPLDHPASDSFIGFTMIKAKELTYPAIIEAMERGDVYGSSGPIIRKIYVEDGVAHIETDPCAKIILRTEDRTRLNIIQGEDTLTEGVFDLKELKVRPRFIRFEVLNAKNQKAMTRAYLAEEFDEGFWD